MARISRTNTNLARGVDTHALGADTANTSINKCKSSVNAGVSVAYLIFIRNKLNRGRTCIWDNHHLLACVSSVAQHPVTAAPNVQKCCRTSRTNTDVAIRIGYAACDSLPELIFNL